MSTPRMICDVKESERLLYHYTSLSRARDLILPTGKLRMGRYSGTNDPKESKAWEFDLGTNQNRDLGAYRGREVSNRLSATLKDRCRVLCFSMDTGPLTGNYPHEILQRGFAYPRMWAQYGEKHTGVCLVFDKAMLEAKMKAIAERATHAFGGKVTYRDRSVIGRLDEGDYIINIDYLETHGFDAYWNQHLEQFHRRLFFEKLQDWKDEREFRYVLFVEPEDDVYVEFGDALVGVVFGDAVDEKLSDEVVELLLPTKVEMTGLRWKNCAPWYDFGNFKYDRQLRKSPWFKKKPDTPPSP
mgnify:CR=1 FL=1